VKYVSSAAAAAAGFDKCVDVRLRHNTALRHAIAYQNTDVTSILDKKCGIGMHEITAALLSGIAFCHACAYDAYPTLQNTTGGFMHLVNGTDFTASSIEAIKKLVTDETLKIVDETRWSGIRHNFRVATATGPFCEPLAIECHVTDAGVVFFRREKDDFVEQFSQQFIGAAYVPPSLNKFNDLNKFDGSQQFSGAVYVPHALQASLTALAVQTTSSKRTFLRNATESLFHLNSICIQNRQTRLGKPKTHAVLRTAWLHTQMLHAARVCGGMHNADYCGVYAHLSNLSTQPLDVAGYWASVPYV